jgi:hypothetical protein
MAMADFVVLVLWADRIRVFSGLGQIAVLLFSPGKEFGLQHKKQQGRGLPGFETR